MTRGPRRFSRRSLVLAACAAVALAVVVGIVAARSTHARHIATVTERAVGAKPAPGPRRPRSLPHRRTTRRSRPAPRPAPAAPPPHVVSVASVVVHFVDPGRTMVLGGQAVPRSFDAIVRYPVGLTGPFPLIVFGHGFAVDPAPYALLLDAWTRAGYVVVAPIFPLENMNAPGGPNEKDLVNQPADMTLVINSLAAPQNDTLARVAALTDLQRVAVAGQSDGGDTALAAAYGPGRDPQIAAAVILSGAEDPFAPPFAMPAGGPPLLAIQGTADTINPPPLTYQFFDSAHPPKYLLKLLGAGHQPPYTEPGETLSTVETMTLAFLDRYLKGQPGALTGLVQSGSAGPGTVLQADP